MDPKILRTEKIRRLRAFRHSITHLGCVTVEADTDENIPEVTLPRPTGGIGDFKDPAGLLTPGVPVTPDHGNNRYHPPHCCCPPTVPCQTE